ncbi:MAG: helix-turn-helix transcriptional regulator [Bacteroidetes bacterium]|nr:helix-turn-helix transcriptional regulator [Bacteroidota bacterium]
MKNNKLNQREFAEKINVKKQYVSWWVNDKVEPGYKSIARILQAFPEVDANWLIRGKNEKNGNNNIVNEQKAIYNICKECENKERTIRNLNYIIDDLKCKLNECFKKLKEKKI